MVGILCHRTTAELGHWIDFDDSKLQEGLKYGRLVENTAHGCVQLHGPSLGTIKDFDADSVHYRLFHSAPRAILILDAQGTLFAFLCHIAVTLSTTIV